MRPDHVLDGIEDLRLVHQLVRPSEQQMHLVAPVALQRLAGLCLVRLQRVAIAARLGGGHDADWRVEALAPEGFDSGWGHGLWHDSRHDRSVDLNRRGPGTETLDRRP